eukprot:12127362-Alexandrium_andersonii.AAC.1
MMRRPTSVCVFVCGCVSLRARVFVIVAPCIRVSRRHAHSRKSPKALETANKFGIKCPRLPERSAGGNAVEF